MSIYKDLDGSRPCAMYCYKSPPGYKLVCKLFVCFSRSMSKTYRPTRWQEEQNASIQTHVNRVGSVLHGSLLIRFTT
eukprot:1196173-Prorocentrum_minimum.AAC.6